MRALLGYSLLWLAANVQSASAAAAMPRTVTFSSLGIHCEAPKSEWGAQINQALRKFSGQWLDGEGKTCGSAVNIVLNPVDSLLRDVTLKDLNCTRPNARVLSTVQSVTTVGVRLVKVRLDRNCLPSAGDPNNSGGGWFANIRDFHADDLEVTGDGKGKGLLFADGRGICQDVELNRPSVHDIRWQGPDPGREPIDGLRFNGCSNVTIVDRRIYNLLGNVSEGSYRSAAFNPAVPTGVFVPYQIHGTAISRGNNLHFIRGITHDVATAVDVSGGNGQENRDIWFDDDVRYNIGDFCEKWVHNSGDSGSHRTRCTKTGAIIVNNGALNDPSGPHNITIADAVVRDPDAKYCWKANGKVGAGCAQLWLGLMDNCILLGRSAYPKVQMRNVKIVQPTCVDDQSPPTMRYCVFSDSPDYDFQIVGLRCSRPANGRAYNLPAQKDLAG